MADPLAIGLSELTTLLLSRGDVAESPCAVADIVARMLPGSLLVGVTLTQVQGSVVGGSAEAHPMVLEESRLSDGHDPATQAMTTAQEVSIPDVAQEHRWGAYQRRMLARGVKSVHIQPVSAAGAALGALSLYSNQAHTFTTQLCQDAALIAEHIGVLLAVDIDSARQTALTEQLRAALASRSTIDQALGIVMAERRCTRDSAFAALRDRSQRHNIRIAELAADIIEAVSGSAPGPVHFAEPQL
ncbi:ANTAR domain-containing protein [Nocardia brasiliensis]|uniref:ANTAR domain-containing protein n=1 Tax=Nocardia brasiliensis TaxID=37326 RepID=A0A6G9XNZ3_NOCBR|nr:ANTAR domain-containing protein [Nocardia brasiliensis]QIS02647.1 ANTAR domain-containing protein [Nocardia brasiliensis]